MKAMAASLFLCSALCLGCSDDSGAAKDAAIDAPERDRGPSVDSAMEVATPDMEQVPEHMGQGCSSTSECGPGAPDCVMFDLVKSRGICSTECKKDDPETPVTNEDSCPKGFICGEFNFGAGALYHYCLKRCTPSTTQNPCPANSQQTCDPLSTRYTSLDQAVCWYPACRTGQDCPVTNQTSCSNDADCKTALGDTAFCSERLCALPGTCSSGGLCTGHAHGKEGASIGDPCKADMDCPDNARCNTAAAGFPNGYCTIGGCSTGIKEFECPAGSTCYRRYYGGLCHRSCYLDNAKTCRGSDLDRPGDYDCYAWNNFEIDGFPVAATPVCAIVDVHDCASPGSDADCSAFGAADNPTNMACRDRRSGKVLPEADPKGFCLDDTPSAPYEGSADAGAAASDAGSSEAGSADASMAEGGVSDASAKDAGAPEAG